MLDLVRAANPADEIVPRIWLGSIRAAHNEEWLKSHDIDVVFNCTKNFDFHPLPSIKYRIRVPVDDNLQQEEIEALASFSVSVAYEMVRLWKEGRTILVHCAAGMQRSAACVSFFLVTIFNLHTQEAIDYIRQRRQIAFLPQANFRQAIDWYDTYYYTEIKPALGSPGVPQQALNQPSPHQQPT